MTEAELFLEVTDHEMDPWCFIRLRSGMHLFGWVTDASTWRITSTLVTLDDTRRLGVTKHGTMYALGRMFDAEDLPPDMRDGLIKAIRDGQAAYLEANPRTANG